MDFISLSKDINSLFCFNLISKVGSLCCSYPYRNWYADINNLKLHIEERCKEIVEKYHEQTVNYDTKLKEAYKDGEECGMIYEQLIL